MRLDLGRGFGGGVCPDLPGFSEFWILDGCGRLEGLDGVSPLAPPLGLADGLGGWLGLLASFFVVLLFLRQFQKSERRLSFRLCRSRRAASAGVTGGSGRRVLGRGRCARLHRAVILRGDPSRGWCSTALVALRGGCPLSRAVRRPALAVTLSSVIRGGDEPRGELSVLARKRSGDRGDLSFPVVTGIG